MPVPNTKEKSHRGACRCEPSLGQLLKLEAREKRKKIANKVLIFSFFFFLLYCALRIQSTLVSGQKNQGKKKGKNQYNNKKGKGSGKTQSKNQRGADSVKRNTAQVDQSVKNYRQNGKQNGENITGTALGAEAQTEY